MSEKGYKIFVTAMCFTIRLLSPQQWMETACPDKETEAQKHMLANVRANTQTGI